MPARGRTTAARSPARVPGRAAIASSVARVHGAVRAPRIEPSQPAVDVGDVVGRQVVVLGERRARVGLVDAMERDTGHRERLVAAQVGDERSGRRVAGIARVVASVIACGSHDGDPVDFDDPARRSVAVPVDGLRSLPPSERDGHGTVGDQWPEPRFPQHGAEATRPPATRVVGIRRGRLRSGAPRRRGFRGSGIRGSGRQRPGCRGGRVRAAGRRRRFRSR